jgi:hypothetical protein
MRKFLIKLLGGLSQEEHLDGISELKEIIDYKNKQLQAHWNYKKANLEFINYINTLSIEDRKIFLSCFRNDI